MMLKEYVFLIDLLRNSNNLGIEKMEWRGLEIFQKKKVFLATKNP